MIEEYHLSVFIGRDFNTLSSITRRVLVGVNVDNFPVTLITEKKACIRIGVDTEVWRVI